MRSRVREAPSEMNRCMPDDARTALGREQGDFLRRLLGLERPSVAGSDASRLEVAGASLRRKRTASMLKAWPSLVSLGELFEPLVTRYFQSAQSPPSGDSLGDAWDFVLWMSNERTLHPSILRELVRNKLWKKRTHLSIRSTGVVAFAWERSARARYIAGFRVGSFVRIFDLGMVRR